jgi:hypothetical protein
MPPNTPSVRKVLFGILTVLLLALLFGMLWFSAGTKPQPRKYSSSAIILVTPLPAGGLNAAIQTQAFGSLPNVELKQNGMNGVVQIIAFAPTAEAAEAKAATATESLTKTIAKVLGAGVRASIIQSAQKAKLTTILDR